LRVIDSLGSSADEVEQVVIGNRAPTAGIVVLPAAPVTGQSVAFISNSSDSDGWISAQSWDLDNDGQFNDGPDVVATRSFAQPGDYLVGLSATDNSDATATTFTTVSVSDAPLGSVTAGRARSIAGFPLMSPFPIVHMSGIVHRKGIKLRLLSVTAPVGATVAVLCRGHGCPFRKRTRTVESRKRSNSNSVPGARSIRIRGFESRLLRGGAILQLFVRRGGEIGKYTRIKVRSGRVPSRVDRCLLPDPSRRVVHCPSS
jgi:PKD repeat protein